MTKGEWSTHCTTPDTLRAAASRGKKTTRGGILQNEVMPGLIDPDCVADVFAEGFASIEKIGSGCVRFTLYATRDLGDGDIDRLVVARIVAPSSALPTWLAQTSSFAEGQPFMTAVSEDTLFQ